MLRDWYEEQARIAARDDHDIAEARHMEPMSSERRIESLMLGLERAVCEGVAVEMLPEFVAQYGAGIVDAALPLMRQAAMEARRESERAALRVARWDSVMKVIQARRAA
jgi:ABC-type phosphate transport system permease subunit